MQNSIHTPRTFPVFLTFLVVILPALSACRESGFNEYISPLGEAVNDHYLVEEKVTYSVPFGCTLSRSSNLSALIEGDVELGPVRLERNPHRTIRDDVLTEVENAAISEHVYETWIWLESLEELELASETWNEERIRRSTKKQLLRAMETIPSNRPSRRRPDETPLRADFARAKVVKYRYEGRLKFQLPGGLSDDIQQHPELGKNHPFFVLPFVFSSPDLLHEGVRFVIKGGSYGEGRHRVQVSQDGLCQEFKDRRQWG